MLVKIHQVLNAINPVNVLVKIPLDFKTAYTLERNKRLLAQELNKFKKDEIAARQKMEEELEKFNAKAIKEGMQEEEKVNGQKELSDTYSQVVESLASIEIELDIRLIKMSKLIENNAKITTLDLEAIEWMLDNDLEV